MIARNTDRRNGTKMDSAACIPATIITTLAAASREWVPIHDLFLFIMCNTSCKVEIILLDLHALSDYKSIGCCVDGQGLGVLGIRKKTFLWWVAEELPL